MDRNKFIDDLIAEGAQDDEIADALKLADERGEFGGAPATPRPEATPEIPVVRAGKEWLGGVQQRVQDVKEAPTLPEKALRTVGGAAASAIDIPLKAGRVALEVTPGGKQLGAWFGKNIKATGEQIGSIPVGGGHELGDIALGAKQMFSELSPRTQKNIGAGMNIAGVFPAGKVLSSGIKGTEKTGQMVSKVFPKPQSLDKAIETGISKGIKPSVVGKKTLPRYEKFYDNANNAVRTISENKNILNIVDENGEKVVHPKNAGQFAQAIDQTKKKIYKDYHDMAVQAGDAGAQFDVQPILKKLDKVASEPDEIIKATDPRLAYPREIREYANQLKSDIHELQGASPQIIEERIKHYNKSLKGFYDGRVTREKAEIDASLANAMREELDNKIMSAAGEGYQELKNKYGALKDIESEVNHRAIVNARKSNKGILDFTDIFSGGDLALGIVSMNPAWIAKAAAQKGIMELWKHFNNPDRAIERMFNESFKEPKKLKIGGLHSEAEKSAVNKELFGEKISGRWRMKYPKKSGLLEYKGK